LFEPIHRTLDRVTKSTAVLAGYALLGLSFAICLEIILRRLFSYSLQGIDEIGGYVLAGVCAFGFAYALMQRAHTRIDLLLVRGGPRLQVALNLFSAVLMAGIACFMAWRAYATLVRSIGFGSLAATPLQTPIWIPQAVWFSGFLLFAIVACFLMIRSFVALRRGAAEVNALIGPVTLGEEIKEEVHRQSK
jgi:TRAP-type mannitol/chloroaromatic compound transport system permease small subunit